MLDDFFIFNSSKRKIGVFIYHIHYSIYKIGKFSRILNKHWCTDVYNTNNGSGTRIPLFFFKIMDKESEDLLKSAILNLVGSRVNYSLNKNLMEPLNKIFGK